MSLFNKLLPDHTRGTKTNFNNMSRAFNDEVVRQLREKQPAGGQGNLLTIRTAQHLQNFDRIVATETCRRLSAGMLEAISGLPSQQPSMCVNVQQVLNGLEVLKKASSSRQRGGQENAAGTSGSGAPKAYASKADPGKQATGSRQGEGKKGCRAFGWVKSQDGVGLWAHRKSCAAYQAKHKYSWRIPFVLLLPLLLLAAVSGWCDVGFAAVLHFRAPDCTRTFRPL